jgi:hypothetical protein
MFERPSDYNKEIKTKLHKILGYLYFTDRDHPLACGKDGFVYYHRHIASTIQNKWIGREDVVHHRDENKTNNDLSNLEVMSASEHCLAHKTLEFKQCPVCGCSFLGKNKRCSKACSVISRTRSSSPRDASTEIELGKFSWPTIEEANKLISEMPMTEIAKKLGCSDCGFKKFCKRNNITLRPPGYWATAEHRRHTPAAPARQHKPLTPIKHGTLAAYGRGCRCPECKKVQGIKMEKYRLSKLERPT